LTVGSYFGFPPPTNSFLAQVHLLDASNSTTMMKLSIIIGVAHLVIANAMFAWSRRWTPVMLAPIGWSGALIGGLAVGLGNSGIRSEQALTHCGLWGMSAGAILILLFSSERPLFTLSPKTHARRLIDGILSLTNITRAFGDVLSYLRLFALGLASAQLAATFNELTYKASCCVGIGSFLAIVAVVFGHGLNFALAIMSGVVHGLRLNCIEFFGWSLPDEGYPFQPFNKRAT
jgi:V/A-type H+-transporting ATPase subunit I